MVGTMAARIPVTARCRKGRRENVVTRAKDDGHRWIVEEESSASWGWSEEAHEARRVEGVEHKGHYSTRPPKRKRKDSRWQRVGHRSPRHSGVWWA